MIDYFSYMKISNALTDICTDPDYERRSFITRALDDFIRDNLLDWDTYSPDAKYKDYKIEYK